MVQSLLLFTLGFLVATLLGLLLAPFLWRRAQALMRRRLEALVPMTLDEVRADRDALRAEHAMAMRRLEMENEEIRQLDAVHLVEISRARETLKTRDNAISERDARLEDAGRLNERLALNIRARERELAAVETSLRVASREIGAKRDEIALLRAAKNQATKEQAPSDAMSDATDGALSADDATPFPAISPPATPAVAGEELDGRDVLATALRAAEERAARLETDLQATDALLRGKIAELSARVVQLAALAEGEASPLPDILAQDAEGDGPEASALQRRMAALIERSGGHAIGSDTERTAPPRNVAGDHNVASDRNDDQAQQERAASSVPEALPPMPSADPLERFVLGDARTEESDTMGAEPDASKDAARAD